MSAGADAVPARRRVPPTPDPLAGGFPPANYWVRVGAALIAIVIALRLIVVLESVLLVVLGSFVFAIGLQPAIRWLEDRGVRSVLAMGIIMVAGLVLFGGLAALSVPLIVDQIGRMAAALPEQLDGLLNGSGPVADLEREFQLSERLTSLGEATPSGLVAVLGAVGEVLFQLVLVLTLTPYFALAIPRAKRWLVRLLYREDREDVLYVLNRSTELMANYVAGNLFVSLIAGIVTYVGLTLLGVPFAFALAVWVAVTDMIPAVGATIGAIAVVGVAALTGIPQMVGAAVLTIGYQQVENFFIIPRVMHRAIDVNPATGIVALLVGGVLAGPIGALLALPVAAMIKIVLVEFVLHDRLAAVRAADAADQEEGGPRPRRRQRSSLVGQRLP